MSAALRRRAWPMPALVFLGAALVYASAGFRTTLARDGGGYLYAGQQLLKGVPPYQSIFTHKGPLAPFVVAAGVALTPLVGVDDVYTVRVLFYIFGCLTVAGLYLLVAHLAGSWRAGVLAALAFLGYSQLTRVVAGGPEPKVLMLTFVVWSLYLTSTRRWLWAGLCGSLAALTWQPTLVFPAITLLLAGLQPRQQRRWAVLLTLAGGLAPVALFVAYFIERDALSDVLERAVTFNLAYPRPGHGSLLGRIVWPAQIVASRYRAMLAPIVVGFAAVLGLAVWRLTGWRSLGAVGRDPWAPVLLSFVFPILWSLKDFQGAPDFFIFLPFVTLGFSFVADRLLPSAGGQGWRRRLAWAATAGVCLLLLAVALLTSAALRGRGLESQQRAAGAIIARFGPDVRIASSGLPPLLALTHTTDPLISAYPFLDAAFEPFLEQRFPGGFAGWMQRLQQYDPQLIAVQTATSRRAAEFMEWLEGRYALEQFGPWELYAKRKLSQ